jgi:hypothetical protein
MGTTTTFGIRFPATTDNFRPAEDMATLAGDVDTSMTSWVKPLFIQRASDSSSITNTTTLAVDPVLLLAMPANTKWEIHSQIIYNGGTGGDFTVGWNGPSGSSFTWSLGGLDPAGTGVTGSINRQTLQFSDSSTIAAVGTAVAADVTGLLVISTTAGNFQLKWAQGTSNGTATLVKAGSFIIARRVA